MKRMAHIQPPGQKRFGRETRLTAFFLDHFANQPSLAAAEHKSVLLQAKKGAESLWNMGIGFLAAKRLMGALRQEGEPMLTFRPSPENLKLHRELLLLAEKWLFDDLKHLPVRHPENLSMLAEVQVMLARLCSPHAAPGLIASADAFLKQSQELGKAAEGDEALANEIKLISAMRGLEESLYTDKPSLDSAFVQARLALSAARKINEGKWNEVVELVDCAFMDFLDSRFSECLGIAPAAFRRKLLDEVSDLNFSVDYTAIEKMLDNAHDALTGLTAKEALKIADEGIAFCRQKRKHLSLHHFELVRLHAKFLAGLYGNGEPGDVDAALTAAREAIELCSSGRSKRMCPFWVKEGLFEYSLGHLPESEQHAFRKTVLEKFPDIAVGNLDDANRLVGEVVGLLNGKQPSLRAMHLVGLDETESACQKLRVAIEEAYWVNDGEFFGEILKAAAGAVENRPKDQIANHLGRVVSIALGLRGPAG
jgi:hypothetical protein